jgi:peptidoglycan/LPS O-acetylase OafA/YrhL
MWLPFRIFEFALGMAVGSAFVTAPARLIASLRAWPRLLMFVLAAIGVHTLGGTFAADQGYARVIAQPLIVLGLAGVIVACCVLASAHARAFATAPLRLLAWIGTISYGVLIINESFRVVNLYLIMKGWQWGLRWWLYVVVLYVPLTVLLAYPLSVVLRLVPAPRWWPRLRRIQPRARTATLLDDPAPEST